MVLIFLNCHPDGFVFNIDIYGGKQDIEYKTLRSNSKGNPEELKKIKKNNPF